MLNITSEKDNYEYALRAWQNPEIRNTDEFRTWLSSPDNRRLYLDILACQEAVARNQVIRQRRKALFRRIMTAAAAVAVISVMAGMAWFLNRGDLNLQSSQQSDVLFSSLQQDVDEVTLQSGNSTAQVIYDSSMDMRDGKEETSDAGTPDMLTVTVPRGKDFKLTLADGTEVWLNGGSALRYPAEFAGNERRVELMGEAYFHVSADKEHPFIVRSDRAETRVLGTKFNFRAYPDEDLHVTLVSGSVSVKGPKGDDRLLTPGQDIACSIDGIETVREVNTNCYTAWTEGFFYFEDATLEEILRTLGRWYNVTVRVEPSAAWQERFNFWAERHTPLADNVELINRIGKVTVNLNDNELIVTK